MPRSSISRIKYNGSELSTFGRELVQLTESLLAHPARSSGLVVSGDPVSVGSLVGVALGSAAAATDQLTVATDGVFTLSVLGFNSGGSTAISIGDLLYIETGVINKDTGHTRFGIALGAVESAQTTAIPVKVGG
jgi:predicted RecA/RadA family phage recombinase